MTDSLFIFLAGIALSAGLAYLWIGVRERGYRNNFFFGLFAVSAGVYYLLLSAENLDERIRLFFAVVMFVSFPWYFAFEAKCVRMSLLNTITVLGVAFYISLFLTRGYGAYQHLLSYPVYVLTGGYCIRCCYKMVRSRELMSWLFLLVTAYYCLFAIEEIAFDTFGDVLPWRGLVSFTYLDLFPVIIISMKFTLLIFDQLAKGKLEEAISSYHENIENILNLSKRFVVALDLDGKVGFANPFFMEFCDPNERIIGVDFLDGFIPDRDQANFRETVLNNETTAGDVITSLKTGTGERSVAWSFVKLRGIGSPTSYSYIYLFGADMTRQVEAERDLKNAYDDLEVLKNKLLAENIQLKRVANVSFDSSTLIGESPLFKYVLSRIDDVAPSDIPVLLEGETGVGKELFANEIHHKSLRSKNAFVKVNCAAIPAQLLESELFGFERGAFTGADRLKRGMFELAHGGTLFLDEIGDLPITLQPKLLRVLQEGEMQRLGSEKAIKVNTRLIAATNRSLEKDVEHGLFRSDLYYRINVFPITVPPLRQRKPDIPLLVKAFTNLFNDKYRKNITQIPGSLMDDFMDYPWPGNVRQLRNVIERAVITSTESILRLADSLPVPANGKLAREVGNSSTQLATLEECERTHIVHVLEHCHWQLSGSQGAAAVLGLPPSTLRSKMKKLRIRREPNGIARG